MDVSFLKCVQKRPAIDGECHAKRCNSSPVGWGFVTKMTLCQRPVAIWALLSSDGV